MQDNAVPADTAKALNALANAALEDAALVETAVRYARSSDADVRLAASEYLRTLPSSNPGRIWIEQALPE